MNFWLHEVCITSLVVNCDDHTYKSRKLFSHSQLVTSNAEKSTGAMDVEAGTKLGAQCCHVQAGHDPVVSMELYEELSSKQNDEEIFQIVF